MTAIAEKIGISAGAEDVPGQGDRAKRDDCDGMCEAQARAEL